MDKPERKIIDALDIETFLLSASVEEAKQCMKELLKQHGFHDTDIVFAEKYGLGTRIRARANIYRPGMSYGWLTPEDKKEQ